VTCNDLELTQLAHPRDADAALGQQLTDCWIAVTNTGGAAGFPFPPVGAQHVAPAVETLTTRLDPQRSRMVLARSNGTLAGWVLLSRDPNPLIAHWGTVNHLQTHPAHRGKGIGTALMQRLRQIARDEMGLEQLHLAARGGAGLEEFYARLGWRETGRWPGKLRLAPGDTRDEVLMILSPL
jgi:GNAT superfamily N-acetyltransferase